MTENNFIESSEMNAILNDIIKYASDRLAKANKMDVDFEIRIKNEKNSLSAAVGYIAEERAPMEERVPIYRHHHQYVEECTPWRGVPNDYRSYSKEDGYAPRRGVPNDYRQHAYGGHVMRGGSSQKGQKSTTRYMRYD